MNKYILLYFALGCTIVLVLGNEEVGLNEFVTALSKEDIPVREPSPIMFNKDRVSSSVSRRIIGGNEATPHAYPYQVALYIYKLVTRYFCGASLITPEWVLTAAHCVDTASYILVVLGTHDLDQTETSRVVYNTTSYIVHKDYDEQTIQNDIALIRLPSNATLNSYINTISIPYGTDSYTGLIGRCLGWGRIDSGAYSNVLRYVDLEVISNAACSAYEDYAPYVFDQQLCTSGEGIVGSCNYDSGGPLVINGVQVGIVSFGHLNCSGGYPSAFTRLTYFSDWIVATMRDETNSAEKIGYFSSVYVATTILSILTANYL